MARELEEACFVPLIGRFGWERGCMSWLHEFKDGLFQWMESLAPSPHPGWWLFALAFAESSFFPLPPDVLLIALGVVTPERPSGMA